MNKNPVSFIKKIGIGGSILIILLARVSQIKSSALVGLVVETEKRLDARMGFAAYDYRSGKRWEYKANDRFPINRTRYSPQNPASITHP